MHLDLVSSEYYGRRIYRVRLLESLLHTILLYRTRVFPPGADPHGVVGRCRGTDDA